MKVKHSFDSVIFEKGIARVSIVSGNSKLGLIDNISLTPGSTCAAGVPCRRVCYAMKAWQQYPKVRRAWKGNEKTARDNPEYFFDCIDKYLVKKEPRFFRIHVAGDFFSRDYLTGWYTVARKHPGTRFLAFTKRYDLLNTPGRPGNFQMIVSAWPGLRLPRTRLPIAYMQDGTETRVKNALECPGCCETCGMCFNLSSTGKSVVFHAH